ncbi:MAG: YraN family protein [Clostridium sp.]|nr:YraN family protein [Clostridium sp.]
MNSRQTGKAGEDLAARYLAERGLRVVERNYRSRQGEIDIIGYHDRYLVFVEVKYRRHDGKGTGEEAVSLPKQQKICRTADSYRLRRRLKDSTPVRYDVLSVGKAAVTWYQDAFPHRYPSGGGS